MLSTRRVIFIGMVFLLYLSGRWAVISIRLRGEIWTALPTTQEPTIQHIDRLYKLEFLREMPEGVTALAVASGQPTDTDGKVFVGTGPVGGVYRVDVRSPNVYTAIGEGLGDYIRFGTCEVNSLAIRDLDRDGVPELLATTSQINPRGRPRLYAWSLSRPVAIRGVTRPDISSSWSHGIGFLESSLEAPPSVFVTYCGHGEII
jgi:hypothetical protein